MREMNTHLKDIRRALMLALLCAVSAPAAIYYVDATNGSDAQDGASPWSPIQSLRRLRTIDLGPGDYVLLKRGEVWTEPLTVASSGSPDAPLTIGAYGQGARPVIDGANPSVSRVTDLVNISQKAGIVIAGIAIRNAPRNGINIYGSSSIVVRDCLISGSRQAGAMVFNSNGVTIEGCEITGNALDGSAIYDGIRIDGTGSAELSGFSIRHCDIHDNYGGEGWNSANGIFLGHTGGATPVLRNVQIRANEIYSNGNPSQNQAGRGLTGTFDGDVLVSSNFIHSNASAGLYFGTQTQKLDIQIANNIFYNNSLRQFGGFTGGTAQAWHNAVFVDDPNITAMGAEVGGDGTWSIINNSFYYQTTTRDSYRGFLRVNDGAQDHLLSADWNLYYSPTPLGWKFSDGVSLGFKQWQAAGQDKNSKSPQ
jgi:parallel beta-helix repeat protein